MFLSIKLASTFSDNSEVRASVTLFPFESTPFQLIWKKTGKFTIFSKIKANRFTSLPKIIGLTQRWGGEGFFKLFFFQDLKKKVLLKNKLTPYYCLNSKIP